jgi:2-iminobutanoate/2-iminopropanoate deaminase
MAPKILHTDRAPQAIGPYSQAVKAGNLVFTSGQLGLDPQTGALPEGIESQTHGAMKNIGAILESAGLSYRHIVKTTIFLKDLSDFAAVNAIYEDYFSGAYPARSCVQVAALPKNALVEIECVATA